MQQNNSAKMELRDVFYALGDFFYWTFQILEPIGGIMNILLSIIIAVLCGYWLIQMTKHEEPKQVR